MTDTERIRLIDSLKTYKQFDDFHGSGKYYFKLQILTDDFKENWVRRIMKNLQDPNDSQQCGQELALQDIFEAHDERKKVGQTEADVKYIVDFLMLIHTGVGIEENIKGDVINSVAPLRQPKTCEKGVIIPSDGNFPKNSNRNYGMLNEFNTMMYHWMEDINICDRSGNDPDAFIDNNGVEGFNPYGTSIEDATFKSLRIYGGVKFIHCRKNCLIEDPNGSILRNHPEKGPIYFGLNIPVKPPYYYELSMLYALIMENHFTLQNTTETFLAELEAILDIEHHDAFKSLQRLLRPYIEDTKRRLKQESAKDNINEEPTEQLFTEKQFEQEEEHIHDNEDKNIERLLPYVKNNYALAHELLRDYKNVEPTALTAKLNELGKQGLITEGISLNRLRMTLSDLGFKVRSENVFRDQLPALKKKRCSDAPENFKHQKFR